MGVKLKVVYSDDSIAICNEADAVECLFWHLDEVKRDPRVAITIARCIEQAYTQPDQLFNESFVQAHYEDS